MVAPNFASQEPKSLPKRKKSLSDDVFAIKNCVARRLMTPLHSKHAQGVLEKFLRTHKQRA